MGVKDDIKVSTNSANTSFSFIFKRFILKSPAIITSEFVLSNDEMIGVNSERNCL